MLNLTLQIKIWMFSFYEGDKIDIEREKREWKIDRGRKRYLKEKCIMLCVKGKNNNQNTNEYDRITEQSWIISYNVK